MYLLSRSILSYFCTLPSSFPFLTYHSFNISLTSYFFSSSLNFLFLSCLISLISPIPFFFNHYSPSFLFRSAHFCLLSFEIISSFFLFFSLIPSDLFSSQLISTKLISTHLISSHLISFFSSQLISFFSSHLISSQLIPSLSSHLLSSHLNSTHLVSFISFVIISSQLIFFFHRIFQIFFCDVFSGTFRLR